MSATTASTATQAATDTDLGRAAARGTTSSPAGRIGRRHAVTHRAPAFG